MNAAGTKTEYGRKARINRKQVCSQRQRISYLKILGRNQNAKIWIKGNFGNWYCDVVHFLFLEDSTFELPEAH